MLLEYSVEPQLLLFGGKMKKIVVSLICIVSVVLAFSGFALANDMLISPNPNSKAKSFKLFATSDIHSYLEEDTDWNDNDELVAHGSGAKLKTVLNERRGNDSLYVDAGDFSMGTLLQTGFANHAYELRLLGQIGCDVATLGNHEFDYGPDALASMLNAAKASGEKLPELVQSNIKFEEENNLKKAFNNYGIKPYVVKDVNGIKVGVFGLEGNDSLDCAPTNGQNWDMYIDAAKNTCKELKDKCDVIVCLSHSGTNPDGQSGEDVDLLKQVPDINVCISGHAHQTVDLQKIGESYLVAPGCYLNCVDQLNIEQIDGKWQVIHEEKIPIRGNITEDPDIMKSIYKYGGEINNEYMAKYAGGDKVVDVIAKNPYKFDCVTKVTKSDEENPMMNLIVDSYIYEAQQNNINDIDVAVIGIGTVRSALITGNIIVDDAFKCCSLGVGADNSAGHPLCTFYVKGSDIRTFVEIETSLGKLKDGINMAYNGLQIKWNSNRMLLDRVTDIKLKKPDGTLEEIDNNRDYKIVANLYALNMLGSVNKLSFGLIKVTPKDANGNEITDYSTCSIKGKDGNEIKEWVAFKNYLKSLKVIPEKYSGPEGRKVNTCESGLAAIAAPGPATIVVIVLCLLLIAILVLAVYVIIKKIKHKGKHKQR